MLRKEIQNKTGLTRKAIEYYEQKGLIQPLKLENGYRDYSKEDLESLEKIGLLRKIGISVREIEKYLSNEKSSLSSILRRKQEKLEIDQKRKEVLELIINGESQKLINQKIELIEKEETIFEKLERAFPGYFGQMIFQTYKPFFNEPLDKKGKEAYQKFVDYLDKLPTFKLNKDEEDYIEEISSSFDMKTLEKINIDKIEAIGNVKEWIKENKNIIDQYEAYKNSEEFQNSTMKKIEYKLEKFMEENKYYEIAIPLIRKFSKSYKDYYEKLIKANEIYLKEINKSYYKKRKQ